MAGAVADTGSEPEGLTRQLSLNQALTDLEQAADRASTHQSLDYDGIYNANFRENARKWEETSRRRIWGYSGATLGRWVLTVVIGVLMGFIAFLLGGAIEHVTLWKIGLVEGLLNPCAGRAGHPDCEPDGEGGVAVAPWTAFGVFCAINAALALGGALPTVLVAPEAAGSGIPEVMGYLNGVHVENIMRLRTLAVKVFGTFCAVTSGLAVGPEGPLVHTGAMIGSGVTRGFKVWRWKKRRICSCACGPLQQFHNDTDRRDFISMGAAVGFAAAFGAPVGGVLFALEEAASFWNSKLMWRTLTATTCACFVMAVSKFYIEDFVFGEAASCAFEDDHQFCELSWDKDDNGDVVNRTHCESIETPTERAFQPGLLSFDGAATFVHWWENFTAPIVLGVAGGVLGALFNHTHEKIGKWRKRCFRKSLSPRTRAVRRLLDVLVVSCITSVVMFSLATWAGHCQYLNKSSGSQHATSKAQACNASQDDFRVQWGSSMRAALPPPPTCEQSCFYKKFPLNSKLAAHPGQPVCTSDGVPRCPDTAPYLNLDTGGCAASPGEWLASGDDCCDATQCSWIPHATPSGIGCQCNNKEFNDMATALLVSREHVIISIMIDPSRYSMATLLCVGTSFFVLMLLTYGSAIPAGVFIPTIMVGACFGGAAGLQMQELNRHWHYVGDFVKASPYALIGAVALLGGVQRSSLSLVVIILEGTGAMKQLLPIILTTVVSKWVGDAFNQGLYHTALELKHIPFLEPEAGRINRAKTARDVMTSAVRGSGVIVFETMETVHSALNKMRTNAHNGFPVVETRPDGRKAFVGLVLRNQVYILIAERHFVGGEPGVGDATAGLDGLGSSMQEDLLGMYRHNTATDDQRTREKLYAAMVHRQDITGNDITGHRSKTPQLIEAIKQCVEEQGAEVGSAELGVKDVMNESPLTVDANCPLPRVWTLFRTMGLRHLVVLDRDHCVVGIITRQDLLGAAESPAASPYAIGSAAGRPVVLKRSTSHRPYSVQEGDEWSEALLGSE